MKKTIALLTLAAALAAPMAAQAHRAWLAPTATTLSGTDAWVGFDAGMSNQVFNPDHAAMRLTGLTITAPDGSAVQPENAMQGRYRSTFDAHLTQNGTYKIANVMNGVMASYTLNGEQKRWRGAASEYPAGLPEGATNVQATRTASRIETFVTLNNPTDTVFKTTGEGLELVPVTHPNDLVVGEPATFKLVNNGQPITQAPDVLRPGQQQELAIQAKPGDELVDDARAAQNDNPCIGAGHGRNHHRQHDQAHDRALGRKGKPG